MEGEENGIINRDDNRWINFFVGVDNNDDNDCFNTRKGNFFKQKEIK